MKNEKLEVKKDMNVFGFDFEKGGTVSGTGDVLMLEYKTETGQSRIPVICSTFEKNAEQFMEEISKQNN